MSDNFLSRWSKRKLEAKEKPADAELTPSVLKAEADSGVARPPAQGTVRDSNAVAGRPAPVSAEANVEPEVPVPTEADLQSVEQGGDVKAFLSDKVSADLKNKAFKALFSRPEYNVMDGLDIYIDDYNTFVPLSQEQIGKMTFSKQLLSRPDLEKLAEDAEKAAISALSDVDESSPKSGGAVMDKTDVDGDVRVNPNGENPSQEQPETLDEQGFEADSSVDSNPDRSP